MVTSTRHPMIHVRELNGQRRVVQQTATAHVFSPPKRLAKLDWLLMDPPEYDNSDDLRDLSERIGR
jgi:hypothetical protein